MTNTLVFFFLLMFFVSCGKKPDSKPVKAPPSGAATTSTPSVPPKTAPSSGSGLRGVVSPPSPAGGTLTPRPPQQPAASTVSQNESCNWGWNKEIFSCRGKNYVHGQVIYCSQSGMHYNVFCEQQYSENLSLCLKDTSPQTLSCFRKKMMQKP